MVELKIVEYVGVVVPKKIVGKNRQTDKAIIWYTFFLSDNKSPNYFFENNRIDKASEWKDHPGLKKLINFQVLGHTYIFEHLLAELDSIIEQKRKKDAIRGEITDAGKVLCNGTTDTTIHFCFCWCGLHSKTEILIMDINW